jgi:hypothetical protein
MMTSLAEGRTSARGVGPGTGALRLLWIQGGVVEEHPLPASGSVTVGRAPDCDLRFGHRALSREHLRIHVGLPLRVEDLGSTNGTRVRGAALAAHVPVPLEENELVDLGVAFLVVKRTSSTAPPPVWTHERFEEALDAACARDPRSCAPFAVVRIHGDRPVPTALVAEALAAVIGEGDVLADYAPGDHELLVFEGPPADREALARRFDAALGGLGFPFRLGVALWPHDATSCHHLFALASAAARGEDATRSDAVVVTDPALEELYAMVDRLAGGQISVLIEGEAGSGTELVAEALHRRSERRRDPLRRLNCAAFPEGQLEREMFGEMRDPSGGRARDKTGVLEAADGGTVFLDEVGDLPPALQTRLLRAIEDRSVVPAGAARARPIDVRFLSATRHDLTGDVARGTFREDLHRRLAGATLRVPALRDRPAGIPRLAQAIVADFCRRQGRATPALSPAAQELLGRHPWPGNVRELRNFLERAVLLCDSGVVGTEHLPRERMVAARSAGGTSAQAPTEPRPRPRPGRPRRRKPRR